MQTRRLGHEASGSELSTGLVPSGRAKSAKHICVVVPCRTAHGKSTGHAAAGRGWSLMQPEHIKAGEGSDCVFDSIFTLLSCRSSTSLCIANCEKLSITTGGKVDLVWWPP